MTIDLRELTLTDCAALTQRTMKTGYYLGFECIAGNARGKLE